jgi:signal transduction histidine kinase
MHNRRPARKPGTKPSIFPDERLSQRKALEERLLHSEQEATAHAHQLEAVFETITDGLVVYDTQGNIVRTNAASRLVLQAVRRPDDIINQSMPERASLHVVRDEQGQPLALEDMPVMRVLRGEVLTGNRAVDVRIGVPGGDEVQLNVGGAPLRNQEGEITGAVCIFRDVTERRRLESELARTNSRLEQVNKVQSDFIAMVSHEFRTTLTGIQGFSELLRDEDFNVAEVKEYASDINADAMRLNRMINELLDLERMKSGKMGLRLAQIDINAILLDTAERMLLTAPRHTLLLDTDETLPQFEGDYDKLTQVVSNLVTNAVKYSPAGGEIVLKSRREDDSVHVSVQDHGIGISEDALEKIFTPYSRIDSETSHYIQGTGLGLAIVRQIVQMHGGRTWAESVLGQGATFHFTLPLYVCLLNKI